MGVGAVPGRGAADEILRANPALHGHQPDGTPNRWGLSPEALHLLESLVRPDMRTAETGAGLSTVLFAMSGTRHTCVCPGADQVEWIRAFCAERSIDLGSVEFVVERSEDALPALDLSGLELALIDGNHAFPTAFIDFFYFARVLAGGGLLFVDDVNLWTGRVLRDFLRSEPAWELVAELPLRSAVFAKVDADFDIGDWTYQSFVTERSHPTPSTRAGRAWRMLLEGDFRGLADAVRRRGR